RDDLDIVEVLDRRTQDVAADPAEPVDAYLDRHGARTPGQGWKRGPDSSRPPARFRCRHDGRLVALAMIRIKVARAGRGHTGATPQGATHEAHVHPAARGPGRGRRTPRRRP